MRQVPTASLERYRLLVEGMPEALTLHSALGEYLYVSPQFEALTGREADELLGISPYDIFHPEDIDHVWAAHAAIIDHTLPYTVQYRIRHADGDHRWVESTCKRTVDDAGQPVLICVTRPIGGPDARVDVREADRRTLNGLRLLAEERQAFLTAISHQARIPMTAILGFSQLLRDRLDDLSDDLLRRCVERLRANAERLGQLIEEVTEAEALRSRTVEATRRPVELDGVVRGVVDDLATTTNPVELELGPAPALVFVDEARIRLLVRALLLNALEHTPADTPVRVVLRREPGEILLSVEDAGPGVPDSLKPRLFEPFFSGSADDHDPGLGLGLYVVSEVAAVHGGRAWVEDRPGGGSVFRVQLPTSAPSGREGAPFGAR